MKHNFSIIYKYSILNKIRSNSFKGLTITLLIIAIAGSILPSFVASLDDKDKYGVVASDEVYNTFNETAKAMYPELKFEQTTKTKDFEDEYKFVLDLNNYKYYSYDAEIGFEIETKMDDILGSIYVSDVATELGLSSVEMEKLFNTPKPEFVNLGEKQGSVGFGSIAWIFNYAYTIVGFMILMMGSQYLGQEIMEEKTTRAMEVIMTSVTASAHMFAKVASNMVYIFILIVEGVVFSTIGNFIAKKIFPDSTLNVFELVKNGINTMLESNGASFDALSFGIVVLLLFLITFLTLFVLVSAIASVVTTVEEFQNSFGIATALLMGAYMASLFIQSVDIRIILSYIPILNFFMIPGLLMSGNIGMLTVFISLTLSLLFFILVYLLSVKIYRVGVLNYSSKGVLKVIAQAFGINLKGKKRA